MTAKQLKMRALDAAVAILVIAAMAYFAHRAVQGQSGLFVRLAVEKEKRALASERADLAAERARLENLTRRMSRDYLDLDLLDEQARAVLGLIRPDEVVIR